MSWRGLALVAVMVLVADWWREITGLGEVLMILLAGGKVPWEG